MLNTPPPTSSLPYIIGCSVFVATAFLFYLFKHSKPPETPNQAFIRGDFKWKDDAHTEIEFVPDPNGKFYVWKGNTKGYVGSGGIDPYDHINSKPPER